MRFALFSLTVVAGWVDAMTFLGLGKVFSSFMSGNVLFLGIATGQRDWAFLMNAMTALSAFTMGAVVGAVLVSRDKSATKSLNRPALPLELTVLFGYACTWSATADIHATPTWQTGLLVMAALGMGIQAAAVFALGIPGVATNALTGSVTLVARSLARWSRGEKNFQGVSTRYLLLLCLAYALSATLVVVSIGYAATAFIPAAILMIVVLACPISRV